MTGSTSGRGSRKVAGPWASWRQQGLRGGNEGGVRTRQAEEPAGRPGAGNGKPPILRGPWSMLTPSLQASASTHKAGGGKTD